MLKDARLVTDRAEGTRRLYAVDTRGVEALRTWLDEFWDESLAAFESAAEQEAANADWQPHPDLKATGVGCSACLPA